MGATGWGSFAPDTSPGRRRRTGNVTQLPRNPSMQHKNLHSAFQELAITSATCVHLCKLAFALSDLRLVLRTASRKSFFITKRRTIDLTYKIRKRSLAKILWSAKRSPCSSAFDANDCDFLHSLVLPMWKMLLRGDCFFHGRRTVIRYRCLLLLYSFLRTLFRGRRGG